MAKKQKTYELVVRQREVIGKKSKRLSAQGALPGVVYGHQVEPIPVEIDQKEMERVYLHAGGNTLIDLKLGESGKAQKVFIHDIQLHPTTHRPRHVDFLVVNLREEITTMVPLVLVGEAPAVKANEGMLLHTLDQLQIRALPSNILPVVEVDISGLEQLDDAIHVSDLEIPENVHLLTSPEELIAKISALRVEPVEEVEAEEAAEAEAARPKRANELRQFTQRGCLAGQPLCF
jgi:large subunit ribosomal protein L25